MYEYVALMYILTNDLTVDVFAHFLMTSITVVFRGILKLHGVEL